MPFIFEDLILSYLDVEGVGRALERLSKRVKRPNPLANGGVELSRHYEGLHEDFLCFLPAAREFAAKLLNPIR